MKIFKRLKYKKKSATSTSRASLPSGGSADVWLQRLAHLTQVGLLALGIFGYFYTVLPVFQNQQLQEQAARLELEKSTAQRRLDELITEQKKIQSEITAVRASWHRERARNAHLSSSAVDAHKLELLAKQQAIDAEDALINQTKMLDSARWELVIFDFFFAHARSMINSTIKTVNKRLESNVAFIRAQENYWPEPYTQLIEAVEVARNKRAKSGQIPASYYLELQSFIEAHRPELQCTPPDFATLEASYQVQLAALEPVIEADLKAEINKVIKEYTDKGEQVEITEKFRQSVRLNISHSKRFETERIFDKRLDDMRKACNDRASSVISQFRKTKGIES